MDTTTERILISQNDVLFDQIKGDIRHFIAPYKKVVAAYAEMNLGDLTPEVYEEIKTGQAIKAVRRYEADLEKSLDDTGVRNPTLRANLLQGTGEISGSFIRAAKAFVATEFRPTPSTREKVLSVNHISLNQNGDLIINDEGIEAILEEHCRYYLQTDDEKELYGIVKDLCEHYEKLKATTKRLQTDFNYNAGFSIVNTLVSFGTNDVSPNMGQLIGLCKYAAMKAKYKV